MAVAQISTGPSTLTDRQMAEASGCLSSLQRGLICRAGAVWPTPGPTIHPFCRLGAELHPTLSPPPGATSRPWPWTILGQYLWPAGADSSHCVGLEVWWGAVSGTPLFSGVATADALELEGWGVTRAQPLWVI